MATSNVSDFASSPRVSEDVFLSPAMTVVAGLGIIALVQRLSQHLRREKIPFAGFRTVWEPDFLVRLRFSWGAKPIIREGYSKVKDEHVLH